MILKGTKGLNSLVILLQCFDSSTSKLPHLFQYENSLDRIYACASTLLKYF